MSTTARTEPAAAPTPIAALSQAAPASSEPNTSKARTMVATSRTPRKNDAGQHDEDDSGSGLVEGAESLHDHLSRPLVGVWSAAVLVFTLQTRIVPTRRSAVVTTKTAPVPQAVAVSPARSGPAIQPRFSMVPPATYPR